MQFSKIDEFIEHDRMKTEGVIERELTLENFPKQEHLWLRHQKVK